MNSINATPEWYTRTSVYQINPRTFSREGTFSAVTKELQFIASLGFGIIYLSCIAQEDDSADRTNWSARQLASETGNPKNPYRLKNHFKIDEEYGTEEDLQALVREAHRCDMKVMLDLVYLHVGPGADVLRSHPDFAEHDAQGNIITNRYHFPQLDYRNSALREYLYSNMVWLLVNFDVDAFRIDVGDNIPLDFWSEGKRRLKAVKDDIVMVNEGHSSMHLKYVFNAAYCNGWCFALHDLLLGQKHLQDLTDVWNQRHELLGEGLMWRYLDNHDTVTNWDGRFETQAGHAGMNFGLAVNYIIDGTPVVYCGNELCDEAKLSMFANRFYPGKFEFTDRAQKTSAESLARQKLLSELNLMKAQKDTLIHGKTVWHTEDPGIICFDRIYGGQTIRFTGNFGDDIKSVTLPSESSVLLSQSVKISGSTAELGKYSFIITEACC